MKKFFCLLLTLFLLPLSSGMAAEGDVTVVASFYPIYIIAKNVLKDVEGVHLTTMTAPSTGCLHDYQLLISDMRALSKAEIFLINGAGMETFLPDILPQFPDLKVVDCSMGVQLICEEEHPHEGHDHHDHDHGEYNAHIWLSPLNAIQMAENIAVSLSAHFPQAADQIRKNADDYKSRLSLLHEELAKEIAPLPRKEIVTFHEAFPYFAHAYGLHVAATVVVEPESPLSPRMIQEVVNTVQAAGNPPLFAEPQYQSPALQAISRETGAPVYILDSMATGDDCFTAYEDTMRKNLQVLKQALSH